MFHGHLAPIRFLVRERLDFEVYPFGLRMGDASTSTDDHCTLSPKLEVTRPRPSQMRTNSPSDMAERITELARLAQLQSVKPPSIGDISEFLNTLVGD